MFGLPGALDDARQGQRLFAGDPADRHSRDGGAELSGGQELNHPVRVRIAASGTTRLTLKQYAK